MRNHRLSSDILTLAGITLVLLLAGFVTGGKAHANSQALALPPTPVAVIAKNIGAAGHFFPKPSPTRSDPLEAGLPAARPLAIDWIFTADAALRSA